MSAIPLTAAPEVAAGARARLEWLDGVRACAASYVVLHHVWLMSYPGFPENTGPWLTGWLVYGHLAVAVFIVVSGLSLALVPLRHGFSLPKGSADFFLRRAWRILPSYWIALAVSSVLVTLLTGRHTGTALEARDVAVYALLLQDAVAATSPNGVFWSIAVEWHIYFLFPLVLLLVRRCGVLVVTVLVTALVTGAHLLGSVSPLVAKTDHLTPQFLVLFVLGVGATWVLRHRPPSRLVPWGAAGAIGLLLGIVVLLGPARTVAAYFWVDLLAGVAAALLMAALVGGHLPLLRRALSWRPLVHVGVFSYSLYLMHAPLLEVVRIFVVGPLDLGPGGTFLVLLLVGVPLAFAWCYGFFLLFERPFIRHRTPRALTAAAVAVLRSRPVDRVDVPAQRG